MPASRNPDTSRAFRKLKSNPYSNNESLEPELDLRPDPERLKNRHLRIEDVIHPYNLLQLNGLQRGLKYNGHYIRKEKDAEVCFRLALSVMFI